MTRDELVRFVYETLCNVRMIDIYSSPVEEAWSHNQAVAVVDTLIEKGLVKADAPI